MKRAGGLDDPALAETSWPLPDEEFDRIAHALRYGTPTHSDLLSVADVMEAYAALIALGSTQGQTLRLAALRRVFRRSEI